MRMRFILQSLAAAAAVMLLPLTSQNVGAQGQAPAAITGQVSSETEGAMEGVVGSAKKKESTVSVSVISAARGCTSSPADRLPAGQYPLKIRAVGYDLSGSATADVQAEQTTTVDLKLRKTKNLAAQLSNAEWMASIPGTEEQKSF